MKSIILLIAIIYLAVVSGRNLHEPKLNDEDSDVDLGNNLNDKHFNSQTRHHRRAGRSYYNHNDPIYYDDRRYVDQRNRNRQQEQLLSMILNNVEDISYHIKQPESPPLQSHYFDNRRNDALGGSNRQQNEVMSKILSYIEEISYYVKRSQFLSPQPQYFYIPVPYPVPLNTFNPNKLNITFPPKIQTVTESNQIWGQVIGDIESNFGDNDDGSRPIDFNPVIPDEPIVKPPAVEHGSSQAEMTIPRPSSISKPGTCKAAILVCCQYKRNEQKQQCFAEYGCNKTYTDGITCRLDVLKRVMNEFAQSYAPVNKT